MSGGEIEGHNSNVPLPLPVEYAAFNVSNNADQWAQLNWSTASELNAKEFSIERSTNGHAFTPVAMVAASGTKSTVSNYEHHDDIRELEAGNVYYRLKQVDFDGSYEYSDVRMIVKSSEERHGVVLMPNPATSEVTLLVEHTTQEVQEIILFDARGKRMKSYQAESDISGSLELSINLEDLPSGMYYLMGSDFMKRLVISK